MNASAFATALLLATQPPVAWPPAFVGPIADGKAFVGGPYAGLTVGTAMTPDGKTLRALMPSAANSSPVSDRDRPAVTAFMAGHADPAGEPLEALLKKHARFVACKRQGEACYVSRPEPLTFVEAVQANTPYAMPDGKVRIEWLYGTAVWYITELTLKGGKIAYVQTQPGWLPLEIIKPNASH